MKLVHPILSSPLIFEEDKINLLIIENTKMLGHLIHELFDQGNLFSPKAAIYWKFPKMLKF